MDNVLVNFQSGLEKIDEETRQQYRAKSPDEIARMDEIPGLFSLMEPMPGAIEAVHKLAEVYDVFILSTAPWKNPSAWSDKVEWVKKYFDDNNSSPDTPPFYKRMIITHRKDFVEGDYLIDDRGKNGTSEFKGEWIQFGKLPFNTWNTVLDYLLPKNEKTNNLEIPITSFSARESEEDCVSESRFKRWIKKQYKDSKAISSLVWKLVLVAELFALFGIRGNSYIWGLWTFLGIIVTILLIFYLWKKGRQTGGEFRIKSIILTKLLANAIAPNRLGTIYLLLFVIHIGWLTNAAMSLFIDSNLQKVILTIIVCIVGTAILIAFFPSQKQKDRTSIQKVVVSGISSLDPKFLTTDLDMFNIVPFVRMFQSVSANKIVIVMSDYFVKEGYISPTIIIKKDSYPQLYTDIENCLKSNTLKTKLTPSQMYLSRFKFYTGEESIKIDGKNEKSKLFLLKLGTIEGKTRNIKDIKSDLIQVIKETARLQFYDNKEVLATIGACDIEFTDFIADYNNFQSSFNQIVGMVQELDKDNIELYFNMTPGTATMSSVMSLIAIDGDRRLFYYSQDKKLPIELRLKEVYKKEIPLENLLSQALENVTNRN